MFNRIALEKELVGMQMTYSDLAHRLGITRETLRRRLNTGNFTRNEIEVLRDIFGIEAAEGFLFSK